jgi:hypothetical protein
MIGMLCTPVLAIAVFALSGGGRPVRVAVRDVPCTAEALRAEPGHPVSEATGQHTLDVSLTNLSASTCVLDGYPVVKLRDAQGRTIVFRYSHIGDQMTTSAKPSAVYVRPAGKAWLRINKYRCDIASTDIASTDSASTVLLELPHGGGTVTMRLTHYPIFDYCQEPASLKVTVSPFEPVAERLYPNVTVEAPEAAAQRSPHR